MPSPARASDVFDRLAQHLAGHGLNLLGGVRMGDFDRAQPCGRRAREIAPSCGTILLAGSGGSDFWTRLHQDALGRGSADLRHADIEARSRSLADGALTQLGSAGLRARAVFPGARRSLNFAQLAEMAGLGTISPVSGWFLHPEYGPWVSFRFALLVDAPIEPPPASRVGREFQPCNGCDQRCVRACPAGVCSGPGLLAFDRCATHRHAGGCATGCEMRRACPCGSEHRHGPREETVHHAATLRALERTYGLGWWQFVPRALRR